MCVSRGVSLVALHMLRQVREFQILWAIVVLHLIDVVDDLIAGEESAKFPFHHEPVLQNVALS